MKLDIFIIFTAIVVVIAAVVVNGGSVVSFLKVIGY